jgi:hypothetical protein
LEQLVCHKPILERAQVVLLAAEGQPDKHIAAGMKITPKKVLRWRKRFLTLGMVGLQMRPVRGEPPPSPPV